MQYTSEIVVSELADYFRQLWLNQQFSIDIWEYKVAQTMYTTYQRNVGSLMVPDDTSEYKTMC